MAIEKCDFLTYRPWVVKEAADSIDDVATSESGFANRRVEQG